METRQYGKEEAPNRMRPAVIIGLGGTGKEVIALIREYLIDQYGSLDQIPIVSFVVIDTDPAASEVEQRSVNAREIRLKADEAVLASIPDIATIWRERENLPHLKRWLPANLEGIGDISQGAKQIRALGRLAFFNNFERIRSAIVGARDKVINPDHAGTVSQFGIEIDPNFQSDPEYYLISSLAGGTGAGMFLDTAFLVKSLDHAREESPLLGYLVMPDLFEDHSVGRVKPNAYAALKELNYFTYNARVPGTGEYIDPRYQGNRPWRVQYVEDGTPIEVYPPPFKYCYLVGTENDDGTVRFTTETRNDFFEMLAHNIVLDFTSVFGDYKRSARDNPGEGFLEPDGRGMPQSYCSFGLSSLSFPRRAVLNACAARLCRSVIQMWRGGLAGEPSSQSIQNSVAQFVDEDLRMTAKGGRESLQMMARWLSTTEDGGNLFGQIDAWRGNISDRIVRERPSPYQVRSILGNATSKVDENLYDDGSADSSKWGPWLREMQENAERQLGLSKQKLRQKVIELLSASHGPEAVSQFLDRVQERIEAVQADLDRQLEEDGELASQADQAKKRMRAQLQRIDVLASAFVFDKHLVLAREAEDYFDTAVRARKSQLGHKAADLGGRLASAMLQYIEELRGSVGELDGLLVELEGRFSATYEEWVGRASSQIVNGYSLYERANTVDECYVGDVPAERELQVAQRLSSDVLEDLDSGLFDLPRLAKIEIRQNLFEKAAADYFPKLQDISAAEILARKPETECERLLRSVHDRSSPFVHLDRNTPGFSADQVVRNRFVGILGGEDSSDQHVQRIIPLLRNLPGLRGQIYPLPETAKDEILIGQELYTYPMRAVRSMEDLQADYRRYTAKDRRLPIHVHQDWQDDLPDQIPVAPQVEDEARMVAAVGLATGLIQSEESEDGWKCDYLDDAGLIVSERLTEEKDFSLLWRRVAAKSRIREYLSGEIDGLVSADGQQPGALHRQLADYLESLAEVHPRASRAFHEQQEHISRFITSHDIAPAE